jgi:hypothetical protein
MTMFNTITPRANGNPVNWIIVFIVTLLLAFATESTLQAQSSPLTVQPSTSRVGVNNTNPTVALDVTGTIKGTAFQGDGSQLTNLPAGGIAALDKVTANTTVVNTAAETNLYSFSVPGNTLGTNNVLRLTIQITDIDVDDGSNCVLRFKYGGTTLGSITIANSSGAARSDAKGFITLIVAADGATNAQVGSMFFHASSFFGPNVGQGTSAVDSTATQTLSVTANFNFAINLNSITLGQAVLEKLS